jgi:nitrogen fixation/metabolism regulation signal transduction histidine kinase
MHSHEWRHWPVRRRMLNGIEAMTDTGGELTVTSKTSEDGQLLIWVSDSGVGLPVGESERIFYAFVTTKPQGTGIGSLSVGRLSIRMAAVCGRA